MAQTTNPTIELAKEMNQGKMPSNETTKQVLGKTQEFLVEAKGQHSDVKTQKNAFGRS